MKDFDTVIYGGQVVNSTHTVTCDIGIVDGRVVALGEHLEGGQERIDANNLLVLPGGIDSHVHLAQPSGSAIMADDFTSGTKSAAFGGNTLVLPFALQPVGESLADAVQAYQAKAQGKALTDYSFHPIITDPTEPVLRELPNIIRSGHRSLKIFMAYDGLKLSDRQILDVFAVARREKALVMIHAENYDMIRFATEALASDGKLAPKYHAAAHAMAAEEEATNRILALAEWMNVAIAILHVSTRRAIEEIRAAQRQGVQVFAETCPQYLVLTAEDLDRPGKEGAKFVCSPPPRDPDSQAACWEGLKNGVFALFSSDHCPFRFEGAGGKQPTSGELDFRSIPNGIPGIETRLPILFSEGVTAGKIDVNRFVAVSSTNHARIYGFYPKKGLIAVGADADIVLWDPSQRVTISQRILHHDCDYTPYEGRQVTGWPVRTLLGGKTIVHEGSLCAEPGVGQFRAQGTPTQPHVQQAA
jgi:dihydropyrimidinase